MPVHFTGIYIVHRQPRLSADWISCIFASIPSLSSLRSHLCTLIYGKYIQHKHTEYNYSIATLICFFLVQSRLKIVLSELETKSRRLEQLKNQVALAQV